MKRKYKASQVATVDAARVIPLKLAIHAAARGARARFQASKSGATIYLVAGVAGDAPLAASRSPEKAGALVAAALAVEWAAAGAGAVKEGATEGVQAELITPTTRERVTYELREAEELITSHTPGTWTPDPRYPRAVQERDYQGTPAEQLKVGKIAAAPDPAILLADSPTAVDGPPVITEGGIVIGGNGRSMGLRLAYRNSSADAYRAELRRRAPGKGISPAAVDRSTSPVLVRVVHGLDSAGGRELAAASSRYNEGLTTRKDEVASAVAAGRRLSPASLSQAAEMLASRDSLRDSLRLDGRAWVTLLRRDGLITDQSAPALVAGDGALTEEGRAVAEAALLGIVAGTVERIRAMPPALAAKVARIVPPLARVEARGNDRSEVPLVQSALDALREAEAAGMTLDELRGQGSLLKSVQPRSADEWRMAAVLEFEGQKKLGERFAGWAELADFDPRQVIMFGKHPTREQTRKALLWGER
ncbi:MAG: hypothetical protein ABII76_17215 [Pseudomonadota bacterium]